MTIHKQNRSSFPPYIKNYHSHKQKQWSHIKFKFLPRIIRNVNWDIQNHNLKVQQALGKHLSTVLQKLQWML